MKRLYRNGVCFACFLLMGILSSTSALAQASASVDVVMDFLARFSSATLSRPVAEVSVNKSTCAGTTQPSLFHHPVGPIDPTSCVSYLVDLPKITLQQKLFFITDIGMTDGVQWSNPKADGVRFTVRINDQVLLDKSIHQSKWVPYCIDLSSFQNRKVKIDFLTHPLQDTSYDWACWGKPRILLFNGSLPLQGNSLPINSGVLALLHSQDQPLNVSLQGANTNQVQNWSYTPEEGLSSGTRWDIFDFDLSNAPQAQIKIEPSAAVSSTWIGYYPFDIRLDTFTPSQALIPPNTSIPLRYRLTNKGQGKLIGGAAQLSAYDAENRLIGSSPIPELEPGNSWSGDIAWTSPAKEGPSFVSAQLIMNDYRQGLLSNASTLSSENGIPPQTRLASFEVLPVTGLDPTASLPSSIRTATKTQGSYWLDNGKMRAIFSRSSEGISYATLYSLKGETWEEVAVWKPLIRVNLNTPQGPLVWEPAFTQGVRGHNADSSQRYTNSWQFNAPVRDPLNNQWNIGLNVTLDPQTSELDIFYTWSTEAATSVHSLLGPNIYVGDGTFGGSKISGLFPGLEYLHGAEPSSSSRDFAPEIAQRTSPDSTKITLPLMAIAWGATNQMAVPNPSRFFCPDSTKDFWSAGLQPQKTIALYWDLNQKWDGVHSLPTPRFSSPNNDEGMNNHRMALFLPSIPDYLMENQDFSFTWQMEPRKVYQLQSQLAITEGPVLSSVRHYLEKNKGLPAASSWPRTPAQERALCRDGFDTVWNGSNAWSHCVDWPYRIAPGFAALLQCDVLSDPALAQDRPQGKPAQGKVAQVLNERIAPMVEAALAEDPSGSILSSENNTHIMLWEFPFHYGYLEAALGSVDQRMKGLISSQEPDGSWLFSPTQTQQKTLGQAGDATMGTTADKAMKLLRHARITGDNNSLQAGLKALKFISQFSIPRGGQVWECPLYQPDILPAAYVIEACVDAWRLTGDTSHLAHAIRWAETAIPFIYLWSLPDKPMMLGSTIPVFGSTFYSHTWLAVPVQWNGLVYSYRLQHLLQVLESLEAQKISLPEGILGFTTQDWQTVIDLILSSATHQQCTQGKLMGTYPDSISNFEKRNAAFINPEDILVNQLAREKADPDIHSVILHQQPGTLAILSSAARIDNVRAGSASSYTFQLSYPAGYDIYALVTALPGEPSQVLVNGEALPRSETPLQKEPGWRYHTESSRLYLNLPNPKGTVEVTIK